MVSIFMRESFHAAMGTSLLESHVQLAGHAFCKVGIGISRYMTMFAEGGEGSGAVTDKVLVQTSHDRC